MSAFSLFHHKKKLKKTTFLYLFTCFIQSIILYLSMVVKVATKKPKKQNTMLAISIFILSVIIAAISL